MGTWHTQRWGAGGDSETVCGDCNSKAREVGGHTLLKRLTFLRDGYRWGEKGSLHSFILQQILPVCLVCIRKHSTTCVMKISSNRFPQERVWLKPSWYGSGLEMENTHRQFKNFIIQVVHWWHLSKCNICTYLREATGISPSLTSSRFSLQNLSERSHSRCSGAIVRVKSKETS